MSATQTIFGAAGITAAAQVVWSVVGPAPLPIEVHSLTYHDGFVTQVRTVSTDGPWLAVWDAQIIDVATGRAVDGCMGRGIWPYPPGRVEARIPLSEWVGSEDCELAPGMYQPVATYAAGEFKTVKRGDVFEVKE